MIICQRILPELGTRGIRLQRVSRHRLPQPIHLDVQIDSGRIERGMTEKPLQCHEVRSRPKKVRGEAVPQRVQRHSLPLATCYLLRSAKRFIETVPAERLSRPGCEHSIVSAAWAELEPVLK